MTTDCRTLEQHGGPLWRPLWLEPAGPSRTLEEALLKLSDLLLASSSTSYPSTSCLVTIDADCPRVLHRGASIGSLDGDEYLAAPIQADQQAVTQRQRRLQEQGRLATGGKEKAVGRSS